MGDLNRYNRLSSGPVQEFSYSIFAVSSIVLQTVFAVPLIIAFNCVNSNCYQIID